MTSLVHSTHTRMPARVYCGEWLIDCPRCRYAQGGELLPYGTPGIVCPECEMRIEIVWPTVEMAHGIARLLSMRPIRYTRNWNPDETLHDLTQENAAHGVLPQFEGVSLGAPLIVEDGRIRVDQLPVTDTPMLRALGA